MAFSCHRYFPDCSNTFHRCQLFQQDNNVAMPNACCITVSGRPEHAVLSFVHAFERRDFWPLMGATKEVQAMYYSSYRYSLSQLLGT